MSPKEWQEIQDFVSNKKQELGVFQEQKKQLEAHLGEYFNCVKKERKAILKKIPPKFRSMRQFTQKVFDFEASFAKATGKTFEQWFDSCCWFDKKKEEPILKNKLGYQTQLPNGGEVNVTVVCNSFKTVELLLKPTNSAEVLDIPERIILMRTNKGGQDEGFGMYYMDWHKDSACRYNTLSFQPPKQATIDLDAVSIRFNAKIASKENLPQEFTHASNEDQLEVQAQSWVVGEHHSDTPTVKKLLSASIESLRVNTRPLGWVVGYIVFNENAPWCFETPHGKTEVSYVGVQTDGRQWIVSSWYLQNNVIREVVFDRNGTIKIQTPAQSHSERQWITIDEASQEIVEVAFENAKGKKSKGDGPAVIRYPQRRGTPQYAEQWFLEGSPEEGEQVKKVLREQKKIKSKLDQLPQGSPQMPRDPRRKL